MTRRHQLLALGLAIGLAGCSHPKPVAAQSQQPIPWSYSFDAGGNPIATYPGTITVKGINGGGGVSLTAPQTWTATQTFQGGPGTGGLVTDSILEIVNIASAPSATTNFDVLSQSVALYTSAATTNWTLNIRGNSGSALGGVLATGQSVTFSVITTQGATAYYNSAVTIDGTAVTPKWAGGAPTSGNASGLDVYTYSVIKTGAGAYTVLASQTQFK